MKTESALSARVLAPRLPRIIGVLVALLAMVLSGIAPASAAADVQAPGFSSLKRVGPKTVKPGDTVRFEFEAQQPSEDIWPIHVGFTTPIDGYESAAGDLFNKQARTFEIYIDPNSFPDGKYVADSAVIYDGVSNSTRYFSGYAPRTNPSGATPAKAFTPDWEQLSFIVDSNYKTPVAPKAVSFADLDGTAKDTYTIPTTTGVEYLVNGSVKAAGKHAGKGKIDVTARATSGYVIKSGSTTNWSHIFSTYAPPVQVTPTAPTFQDEDGTKDDTYTIPSTTGVEYLVDGKVKSAATYSGAGNVKITARAKSGYELKSSAPASWTHSFSAESAEYQPPARSPFVDVSTGQQFYKEMAWMSDQGISTGWQTAAGREYRPVQPINRDAMAAFLYRMAGSPAYTPPAKSPFVDVSPDQQFYKEMAWLADQGISTGWQTPQGREYRPTAPINRDAMAAFLYRMEGSPAYTAPRTSPFTDVSTGQQFYKEMSWMADQGISTGWQTPQGREYRPMAPINRDAMAAFLYRLDARS